MKNQLTSNRLNVNAGIMSWYVKELTKLTKSMTDECEKVLLRIYNNLDYQIEFDGVAMDDSIASQMRMALNKLLNKYYDKFSERSKRLVKKLLKDTNKASIINNIK